MNQGGMRAGDADRERVAERLRIALEEGRLNLHEYDERLRDAFAAKTYAELDALLTDLPGVVPASQSQIVPATPGTPPAVHDPSVPGPDGRYPDATRRWLAERWTGYFSAVAICTGIWAVLAVAGNGWHSFWPIWVAGPWGVVLLVGTVTGLSSGEPQRWAAKQARKAAEKEVRRNAKHDADDVE